MGITDAVVTRGGIPALSTRLQVWVVKMMVAIVFVGGILITYGWGFSASAQTGTTHIVQVGENLSTIARRYGVTVNELARHNGIANVNLVRVGQPIRIPSAASTAPAFSLPVQSRVYTPPAATQSRTLSAPANTRFYTVRSNDTLYGIAARYGVTIQAIKTRNGLSGDLIFVGQRLIIP